MLTPQQLGAYLKRINYQGSLAPSQETLHQLHRAQVMSIPFENLDVLLGRAIQLDTESLMTKLVHNKRGGYCFELNGLFFLVLRQLGFQVSPLAARVMRSDGSLTQKSHRITLVEIDDQQWLADVGFGANGIIEPLLLKPNVEAQQSLNTFRLVVDDVLGYLLQYCLDGNWITLYAFTLEEYFAVDYEMMNYFMAHSSDSIFTQQRVCIIPTSEAWVILNNQTLKIRGPQHSTEIKLRTDTDYQNVLVSYFGIELPYVATLNWK